MSKDEPADTVRTSGGFGALPPQAWMLMALARFAREVEPGNRPPGEHPEPMVARSTAC